MNNNKLLYSECVRIYNVNESFIESLCESGLVHVYCDKNERFVIYDDLADLEQFVRWHSDMDINVPGIEALHHLLKRMHALQAEMEELRNELRFYRQ